MRDDLAEIVVILDRSGSMSTIRDDTIGSFNTFLEDQKKEPGFANFTLVQFDDKYEVVHNGKTIQEVPALNTETFVPRGSTALLDAIGRTINEVGARLAGMDEAGRPGKVIFSILTDGQENHSSEFTRGKIFEMITHQRETYNWEFIFLSADENGIKDATSIGIGAANVALYAHNAGGIRAANFAVSHAVASYRTTGDTGDAMSNYVQQGLDSDNSSDNNVN